MREVIERLKRGHYHGELLFMAANFMTPLVGFLSSLVAMRYVLPAEMGTIQATLLFAPYLSLLHFGAFTGLNRNLAFYLAKGESATAMRMVSASRWVARWNAGFGILFGTGLWIHQFLKPEPNPILLISIPAVTAMLALGPLTNHLTVTYRSGQHFKTLGKLTWLDNGIRSVYLFLPALIGWLGYAASLFLQSVIRFALLKRNEPYPKTECHNRTDLTELFKVGFPIMAGAYISSLFLVVDQSLVALFLPSEQLGYYSLSRLIMQALQIVPATLAIVITPKVAACFGRTGLPRDLRKHFWLILGIHIAFMGPMCLAAYVLVEPVVTRFMPHYAPGTGVAQITALTCLAGYPFTALLAITSTMRKNLVPILLLTSALIATWIIGMVFFKKQSPEITDVAWLKFFITALLSAAIFMYGLFSTQHRELTK